MTRVAGWDGRYLDDFEVGDVYRHHGGRTITETDNTWFSLLTNNPNQLHSNADYASRTEFGRPLVVSTLTLAIVTGLSVPDVSQNAVANLGWDAVRLRAPVFAGDTLYAESEGVEVRPSQSRPGQGIVRVRTRGFNQRGETVIEYERTALVYRRDATPPDPADRAPAPAGPERETAAVRRSAAPGPWRRPPIPRVAAACRRPC